MHVEGADKVQPAPAPELGQHTAEVLREVGYDQREIAEMLASGVAAQWQG
jgi:formyl-CoA transferase